MIVHPADCQVVRWAVDGGMAYRYVREYGLPEPSLEVRLGMTTAWFHAGRLAHWRAEASAEYLDQMMFELMRLFAFCGEAKAYPEQRAVLQSGSLSNFRPSYNEAG